MRFSLGFNRYEFVFLMARDEDAVRARIKNGVTGTTAERDCGDDDLVVGSMTTSAWLMETKTRFAAGAWAAPSGYLSGPVFSDRLQGLHIDALHARDCLAGPAIAPVPSRPSRPVSGGDSSNYEFDVGPGR